MNTLGSLEMDSANLNEPIEARRKLFDQSVVIGDVEPANQDETIYVRLAKRMIYSRWFPACLILLALLSTIFFFVGLSKRTPLWLDITDVVITFFYALEIGARLLVFESFWEDIFNVLDVFLLALCVVEVTITAILQPTDSDITMGLLAFRFFVRIGRTIQVIRHQRQYNRLRHEANDVDFSLVRKRSWDIEEGNYVSIEASNRYDSVEPVVQKSRPG